MVGMDNVMANISILWDVNSPLVEYQTILQFPFLPVYISRLEFSQCFRNWLFQVFAPPNSLQELFLLSQECNSLCYSDLKVLWLKEDNTCIVFLPSWVISSTRQCIWFSHELPRFMDQGESETGKVQRPASLSPVQFLSRSEIREVAMVSENLE